MKSKQSKHVLIQIYDYAQMFNAIQLELALLDIYDAGLNDDTFFTLNDANKEVYMSVKTPYGLTERQTVSSTVLQGDTWASLLASVQVDSILKECTNAGYSYMYQNTLPLSNLGLVDDIIEITEPGL